MRKATVPALVLASVFALTGCKVGSDASGATSKQPAAAGTYRLVTYPDAGYNQFYDQLDGAEKSIWMEIYSLNDDVKKKQMGAKGVEKSLIAAHRRGVDTRVMLNSAFRGNKFNQKAYARLTSAGVKVKWAPTGYIFHIKTTVIDGKTAVVSTANLNAKNFKNSRDASIITTNTAQVDAISKTFAADWTLKGKPKEHTVAAPGLVWSPGADDAMISAITSAKKSIRYSSEELAYRPVVSALAATAKRGVKCTVVMTADKSWDKQFATLRAAGCTVVTLKDSVKVTYIHWKLVLTDDTNLLMGSQNASMSSLKRNRELSLRLTKAQAPNVLASVAKTFDADAKK